MSGGRARAGGLRRGARGEGPAARGRPAERTPGRPGAGLRVGAAGPAGAWSSEAHLGAGFGAGTGPGRLGRTRSGTQGRAA